MRRLRHHRNGADPYLYHATYFNRLPFIEIEGLQPFQRRSIGSEAYSGHARGRIFLTARDGVEFWTTRAEEFAEHASDDVLEDGLIPVLLRVRISDVAGLTPDDLGTSDAFAGAWMTTEAIEPDALEIWVGSSWAPLDYWEMMDPSIALKNMAAPGEAGPIWVFKDESPLTPREPPP